MQYIQVKEHKTKFLVTSVENGQVLYTSKPYTSNLFVHTNEESKFLSTNKQYLKELTFQSRYTHNNFLYSNRDSVQGTIDPIYQYIHNNFYKLDNKPLTEDNITVMFYDIEVDAPDVNAGQDAFPNTELAEQKITAISCWDSKTKRHRVFTWHKDECWSQEKTSIPETKTLVYSHFDNEKDMLSEWLTYYKNVSPNVLSGWNSNLFDDPFIYKRLVNVLGEDVANTLSPFNIVEQTTQKDISGNEKFAVDIIGVNCIDLLHLFKKFITKTMKSYKLGDVCQKMLGINKVEYQGSIYTLRDVDFNLFVDYSFRDTQLLVSLNKELNLINMGMQLQYLQGCNFEDIFGTVRPLDVFFYHQLMLNNVVCPNTHYVKDERTLKGGYVKPSILGKHKWVFSLDFDSQYPHIMWAINFGLNNKLNKNILNNEQYHEVNKFVSQCEDIEKVLQGDVRVPDFIKERNCLITPNGTIIDKSEPGFFGDTIMNVYKERQNVKNKMLEVEKTIDNVKNEESYDITDIKKLNRVRNILDTKQKSLKTLINSFYGAVAEKNFRYYDYDIASSITHLGRISNRWVFEGLEKFIIEKFNLPVNTKVLIAADTDSSFFTLDLVINKIQKAKKENKQPLLGKKEIRDTIAKLVNQIFIPKANELSLQLTIMFNLTNVGFKPSHEIISDVSIFMAKKKYISSVMWNEGVAYGKPRLKVSGLESERSATPKLSALRLNDFYKLCLYKTESDVHTFLEEVSVEFKSADVVDISFSTHVKKLSKYQNSKGSIPINIQAAQNFNTYIKKKKNIDEIIDGTSIHYVHLKPNNPFKFNVIGFEKWDNIKELEKYVDRDLMFEKSFKKPVIEMLNKIGWKLDAEVDMSDIFTF